MEVGFLGCFGHLPFGERGAVHAYDGAEEKGYKGKGQREIAIDGQEDIGGEGGLVRWRWWAGMELGSPTRKNLETVIGAPHFHKTMGAT